MGKSRQEDEAGGIAAELAAEHLGISERQASCLDTPLAAFWPHRVCGMLNTSANHGFNICLNSKDN